MFFCNALLFCACLCPGPELHLDDCCEGPLVMPYSMHANLDLMDLDQPDSSGAAWGACQLPLHLADPEFAACAGSRA